MEPEAEMTLCDFRLLTGKITLPAPLPAATRRKG